SVALWAALPLAITAVTGATLSFPETTRALLAPLGATGADALAPRAKPEPLSSPMTLDAAAARAREAFPGYRIAWMDLPPAAGGEPIGFALRSGGARVEAPSRVWVDPVRGTVDAAHPSTVETLRAWFMALHNGQAFGGLHRGFVVALGLAPAFLGVTGLLIWRRRRANAARPRVAAAGAARTDCRGMGSSTRGNLFSKQ
ncbi:MAG TPA: PepSY-associated TM helix domain-containing protein, partial [Acetobacteraceae bacterium]|nr:PepSY-associated TM helix domain-containing protein [Acetobacteraceae bacterium]